MKQMFRGFCSLSDQEYANVFDDCLFVLDSSFLLSLYRLPIAARDDLLSVLERVANRLWVPHHAALEFHRNRLSVMSDQKKRFSECKELIGKTRRCFTEGLAQLQLRRRHSLIDTTSVEQSFDALLRTFEDELATCEQAQPDVSDHDMLLETLDDLLANKVGAPLTNQEEIESIYGEGANRYAMKLPPGYLDSEKSSEARYQYGGILYQSQYGDLVMGKQILDHASATKTESVVFLTDDAKEDWYWKTDGKRV